MSKMIANTVIGFVIGILLITVGVVVYKLIVKGSSMDNLTPLQIPDKVVLQGVEPRGADVGSCSFMYIDDLKTADNDVLLEFDKEIKANPGDFITVLRAKKNSDPTTEADWTLVNPVSIGFGDDNKEVKLTLPIATEDEYIIIRMNTRKSVGEKDMQIYPNRACVKYRHDKP